MPEEISTNLKRPVLLTLACIVAFLLTALLLILFLLVGTVDGILSTAGGLDTELSTEWIRIILSVAGALISLIGIVKLWRLKRSGFYMYIGGVTSVLGVQEIFGSGTGNVGWMIVGGTILLFALSFGHLK